jgi:hypothetical protein
MTPHLEAAPPAYVPRNPSTTVLYHVVADHLETFLASLDADPDAKGLPAYVQHEFYDYLQCGIFAHGILRPGCDTCQHEMLLAFSCKRRGFCPSCAGRRMALTAAHLVERVIRTLRRLGYLEAGLDAPAATGYNRLRDDAPELAHTLAASVQQRIAFGERAGQKVRRIGAGFGVEGEAPTLTGPRCASMQGFSLYTNTQVPAHRRDQLERLIRYTARGAVSLERLAQDANGDLVYTFTPLWSDGTTGMRLSPIELLEKLAALVSLPRVHLVRYGGCLASHSHLRGAIIPTPRQQGVEDQEDRMASPRWSWARLLKRVFTLDMACCPWCQRGVLRIIAALTQGEVIWKILRHLKLAVDPPSIAPACVRQEAFAWSSA